jgi:aminopeptidase-like protein
MIGIEIHNLAKKFWKINRSITGEGVRFTLELIKKDYLQNLLIHSVPSGTKVFDWIVPMEWHVDEAYIIAPDGNKICDFSINNLHLVGYSIPFCGKMKLNDLKNHLYSLPEQPNAIPYVTSYYKEHWGFCITEKQKESLVEGEYEVVINSKIFSGNLNYGEIVVPGKSDKEVFLSTYICHPSMANNEISGPVVLTYLAKWLKDLPCRNYTYRIVFVPETIGSITYISKNFKRLKKNVFAGFNISCVGDDRSYSYLPSRNGKTISDHMAKHVLKWTDTNYIKYNWSDRGSDERQYCAPGIDLPIASILRTKYGTYPEYHTSLDNLEEVVTPKGLNGGYLVLKKTLELIEKNKIYKTNILCEPQLSKKGLYPSISIKNKNLEKKRLLDIISYCDGENSLLDIAEKINVPAWDLYEHVDKLIQHDLISEIK